MCIGIVNAVYYLECVAVGQRKMMRAPSGNLLGLRRRQPRWAGYTLNTHNKGKIISMFKFC